MEELCINIEKLLKAYLDYFENIQVIIHLLSNILQKQFYIFPPSVEEEVHEIMRRIRKNKSYFDIITSFTISGEKLKENIFVPFFGAEFEHYVYHGDNFTISADFSLSLEDIPYAGTYDIPFIEKQKLLSKEKFESFKALYEKTELSS